MAVNVVCHGDSLTAGYELPSGDPYPTQLDALLGAGYNVFNESTAGDDMDNLLDGFAAEVDAHYVAEDTNIVILWIGSNDYSIGSPNGAGTVAEFQAKVQTYAELCYPHGWLLIIGTVIRRGITFIDEDDWDVLVTSNNAWLSSFWSSFAHGFCDFENVDPIMATPFRDTGDETYYIDHAHLNDAGYALIAAEAQAAVAVAEGVGTYSVVTLPSTAKRTIADYRLSGGERIATIYDNSGNAFTYQGETPALISTPSNIPAYVTGGT